VIVRRSRSRVDLDAARPLATPLQVDAGGEHMMVLAGELDMATAEELADVMLARVESATRLTLDLSQVTFMDSSGLRLILFAQELCRLKRAEFALIPGPRHVQRAFEIAGLLDRLPFQTDPRA
jgi:anti-anti-sigma factor